jgi:hypothetical protein
VYWTYPEAVQPSEKEMIAMPRLSLEQRFWAKVNRTDSADECWEWRAGLNGDGYGQFWDSLDSRMNRAHRVSYRITFGSIPKGLSILHRCDNRRCVNPSHLFLGTQKDNIEDMVKKGRQRGRSMPGQLNGAAKLTADQVIQIKQLIKDGHRNATIAPIFKVHPSNISAIRRGVSWADGV